MPDSLLDQLEYDENAPDVREIMRQIRAHVAQQRGVTPQSASRAPDHHGGLSSVYDDLAAAEDELRRPRSALSVTPSRVPVVGRLLTRLRKPFHQLVIYYVDRQAESQSRFNAHLLGAVSGLIREMEHVGSSGDASRLEGRVRELEARVEKLDAAPGAPAAHESKRG